jgi:chaperonin GroEL
VQNAGEDGSPVVGKLLENSSYNWGFNAASGDTRTWRRQA